MAIAGLDRRASKLEDSMARLRQQKETEERKAWREANSERLEREMFLRVHGPEAVEVTEEDSTKIALGEYNASSSKIPLSRFSVLPITISLSSTPVVKSLLG